MPKASPEYFKQKRNQILDAAYAVCMKKPLHNVSMRDIITESGLSQGGIYRYYSNIIEILIALVDRDSDKYDIVGMVDAVLAQDDIPEQVVGKFFDIWADTVIANLLSVGKIYYEVQVAYASDKEALRRFASESGMMAKEDYLKEKSLNYVMQKIAEGYFRPKLPAEDIFGFVTTSFDGIIRDTILIQHYNFENVPFGIFTEGKLVKSLCVAFILLLDGNAELIGNKELNSSKALNGNKEIEC